jgi:hypothetical protein
MLLTHEDTVVSKALPSYLQSKGILTARTIAVINRSLSAPIICQPSPAPCQTAITTCTMTLARSRVGNRQAIGVNEEYLSRVFNREWAISPWNT